MTQEIKSHQIDDGEVKRADLNTTETGSAVATKVIAGDGIELSSTGIDSGTGDVTVGVSEQAAVLLGDTAVNGLKMSWVSVNSISIGVGGTRDSTNVYTMTVPSLLTVDITSSGVNGLDTGSEATDTWYAVHVIGDTTEVVSPVGLLSLSATAPTLPSGYNVFRRVGWVKNDPSSNILRFTQVGLDRTRMYDYIVNETATRILTGGSATIYTTVATSSFVPTTSFKVTLHIEFKPKNAVNSVTIIPKGASLAIGDSIFDIALSATSTGTHLTRKEIPTDANQDIEYAVTDNSDLLNLSVAGFVDEI